MEPSGGIPIGDQSLTGVNTVHGKYRCITADPPWEQEMVGKWKETRNTRPARLVYPTMPLADIIALPVAKLCAADAHCWLWTTNQFLRAGFEVLEAWGFRYLAPIHWIKPSGVGAWFVSRSQTCLFGYRGRLEMREKLRPNVLQATALRHSQKPECFYELAEAVSHGPRLELFARPWKPLFHARPGWDVWGNEVAPDVELEASR